MSLVCRFKFILLFRCVISIIICAFFVYYVVTSKTLRPIQVRIRIRVRVRIRIRIRVRVRVRVKVRVIKRVRD